MRARIAKLEKLAMDRQSGATVPAELASFDHDRYAELFKTECASDPDAPAKLRDGLGEILAREVPHVP